MGHCYSIVDVRRGFERRIALGEGLFINSLLFILFGSIFTSAAYGPPSSGCFLNNRDYKRLTKMDYMTL